MNDQDNLKTWPENIYLQIGDDYEELPEYQDIMHTQDGVTWCEDSVCGYEVTYIRFDLFDAANATIANLKETLRAVREALAAFENEPLDEYVERTRHAIAQIDAIGEEDDPHK